MKKGSSAAGIAFLMLLIVVFIFALYVLYLNLSDESTEFVGKEIKKDKLGNPPVYEASRQFYDNMRFTDKRISYAIESDCNSEKRNNILEAFEILEDETPLDFYPSPAGVVPEFTVLCSEIPSKSGREGFIVAGEGGPTEVINTTLYGVILSAKVSFFRDEKCGRPLVALHETLHALGFDHNNNPDSILYPTLDCSQKVDASIFDDLNRLYDVESKPDLKITEVIASKHNCRLGECLDFHIKVLNQGLRDSDDVLLTVYSDGKKIYEYNLGDVKIGVTKSLDVENLNLGVFSDRKKVVFVIDEDNKIDELFEDNNQFEVSVI